MLDWSTEKCDPKAHEQDEKAVTEALVWATMYVGIPRITAANAVTFTERITAWSRVTGPMVTQVTDSGTLAPVPITLADVRIRIGLETNASRMSDAAFRNMLINRILTAARDTVARQVADAAKDDVTAQS